LGVTLVHDLVRQLRGSVVTTSGTGVAVTITFPQGLAAAPTIAMKGAF
jgi:two-component sensor histidine kinase